MNTASKKIELLAPAKDKACAFAAIDAGADAVYIGAQGFGARKKAANSLDDIKEIVEYAHKFDVKIYVTVNTIIYDEEIESVKKLICDLYEAGVDALIIQDMGILKMDLPPIELHASTQCNIDSLEKVKFLQSCNVSRVVLPREFSLKEIEHIKKNSSIELEIFIHGALCVCCSGQCYMSDSIGGRSANRGDCAQPCRKKYSVIDATGKKLVDSRYILSMKDLSLESHLHELLEIGVDSFKIEGRLKDEEYVKNVVSFYRKKIDEIDPSLRPSKGLLINDFQPDINKTFNRGYTDFNASGIAENLINQDTPKFVGERIGKISSLNKSCAQIKTEKKLNVGDGLSFFDSSGELSGTVVMKIDGANLQLRNTSGLAMGMSVYRNLDSEFYKMLNKAKFTRKIPVNISVATSPDGFWITLNNEYTYTVSKNFESANNAQKAIENLKSQFSKSADSEFIVENVVVEDGFESFIPVSELNLIRRTFLDEYRVYRSVEYKRQKRSNEFVPERFPVKELDYTFNVSNEKAKAFYESAGAKVKESAYEKGFNGKRLVITKHCIRKHLGLCHKKHSADADKLFLLDEYGKRYKLEFDCKNCKMKIETF